ncbi:MAG: alpha amylase C-terminal domain-containing protein, partial [Propionibacteriaceae bacterium]|nr:alpha amylase C-terminal domain-containing protein [Propionibacteriaceae bacterium]
TNFSPNPYPSYGLHLPAGHWDEILNTDDEAFDGTGQFLNGPLDAPEHGQTLICVPPLGTVWLRRLG